MELYKLENLIDRLYDNLDKKNISKSNKGLILQQPIVNYANRKTSFINFSLICESLKRNILDIKKYFEEEMCIKSTINSNGVLLIEGRFRSKNIEKVLGNYLNVYVFCKECRSSNTILFKQDRVLFIKCNKCKSEKAI
jgi:translation initiation factor 2 subunit 2